MASPETLGRTVEDRILDDPSYLLINFQRMQKGEMGKDEYVEWVKSQAQEILAEQLRREANPMFPGFPNALNQARIRRDRQQEEAHLLTVNGGNRERGGERENINWVQIRFDREGTLLAISSEVGHRQNHSEDRLEQDVALSTLAINFEGGNVNFKSSTQTVEAGFLIPSA